MPFYTKFFSLIGFAIAGSGSLAFAQEPALPVSEGLPTSSALDDEPEIRGYETRFYALGTIVSLKAFHPEKKVVESGFKKAEERIHELEAVLTDYDATSETSLVSKEAVGKPLKVSTELWDVLVASDRWHAETAGAFDSSLGSLTRLWRKYARSKRNPPSTRVKQALKESGWQHVTLDASNETIQLDCSGVYLDFGAIGKGYIVDQAFAVLVEHDLPCCLVNISGNMRCGNAPPGRKGWRVEVSGLTRDGPPLRRIEIAKQAVATSGDLWQYTMIDGQRRSHILDPKSGVGVVGPVAATVVATTAIDADAMATAACILPKQRTWDLAETHDLQVLIARLNETDEPLVKETDGFPPPIAELP